MSEQERDDKSLRAAEYVLGTLPESERLAVEIELERDRELRLAVAYWEEQLGELGLQLTPVAPPESVWRRVRARIDEQPDTTRGRAAGPWRALALAASVAALTLAAALFLTLPTDQPGPPAYASLIRDKDSGAGWLITAGRHAESMTVAAMGDDYPLPPGKSLELWLLPPGGQPVSLGLLPQDGERTVHMPQAVVAQLSERSKLAVSLEPAGGSPTGKPTGKVLWVATVTGRSG